MGQAIIVKDLKKSYDKHKVLQGVTFAVESGTIFALLGSNGAGKTTIINILTTLIRPDAGTAIIGGHEVTAQATSVRQSISLTGQFAAVDDMLSARENLELIGDLRHVSGSAHVATELLGQFGLTEAADRRVATFSGGMRRRLDIAMSLIGTPSIIFLDEPTTGLDPEARNDMWQTIRTLANSGTTIFLTTQYLEEADELADVIALLHKGKIAASGTAAELKRLIPSGLVEVTFHNERELKAAASVLVKDYKIITGNNLVLTVSTGGSVAKLADLFMRLRDADIEPADFAQKVPTLDDVFFKLTAKQKEVK